LLLPLLLLPGVRACAAVCARRLLQLLLPAAFRHVKL
jgi:hypothetical protein